MVDGLLKCLNHNGGSSSIIIRCVLFEFIFRATDATASMLVYVFQSFSLSVSCVVLFSSSLEIWKNLQLWTAMALVRSCWLVCVGIARTRFVILYAMMFTLKLSNHDIKLREKQNCRCFLIFHLRVVFPRFLVWIGKHAKLAKNLEFFFKYGNGERNKPAPFLQC